MAAMPDLSPLLFASRFLLVAYATVATILATACLALHVLTHYDRRPPATPGALRPPAAAPSSSASTRSETPPGVTPRCPAPASTGT